MILSTRIAHGKWSAAARADLKGRFFATDGHPSVLKSLNEITAHPAMLDQFIKWARWHSKVESNPQIVRKAMDNSAGWDVADNLGIQRAY
ncbi:hypothetical protein ACWEJ6_46620 [Nonomuraea sp. NPDC004702]